jgi:hypothetical protein
MIKPRKAPVAVERRALLFGHREPDVRVRQRAEFEARERARMRLPPREARGPLARVDATLRELQDRYGYSDEIAQALPARRSR